jgi:hypothetical protein
MDARRELAHIRKQYRGYQQNAGETIMWFEYEPFAASASAGSTYDDVYDEGGYGSSGRKYKTGVVVPVLMITESEDTKRAIPEGRQPVEIVNVVASIEDFRQAGIGEPFEYKRHLNDIFLYDGRYMSVMSYKVRGRVRDDVLVVVEGLEIYVNQEMPFDVGPAPFATQNLPWPSRLPGT